MPRRSPRNGDDVVRSGWLFVLSVFPLVQFMFSSADIIVLHCFVVVYRRTVLVVEEEEVKKKKKNRQRLLPGHLDEILGEPTKLLSCTKICRVKVMIMMTTTT